MCLLPVWRKDSGKLPFYQLGEGSYVLLAHTVSLHHVRRFKKDLAVAAARVAGDCRASWVDEHCLYRLGLFVLTCNSQ